MKFKSLFLIVFTLLICTVFTTACLDSNQNNTLQDNTSQNNTSQNNTSINPLNKNIEPFKSSFPINAPFGDEIILYNTWSNSSRAGYANETLLPESGIAFYGTLKSINPSVWSTFDQNPPSSLADGQIGENIFGLENGTQIIYNSVSIPGCDDYIYTTVIFEVNDMIKGENTTEVTVMILSGQIDNYISAESSYPTIWDLEVGQQYLVYTKNNEIMHPGFFIVLE